MTEPKAKSARSELFKVVFMIAWIVLAVWFLRWSWSSDGGNSGRDTGLAIARVMCGEAITERLRNPSSAEMLNQASWPVKHQPPLYVVTATVRAENGFGGMVVETFTCEMASTDGRSFSAVNLLQ
jgi:hypothetical protein